jgi:hypothetical protein
MIYARAHDQTVADDYFAAMQRVEQRLDIAPPEPIPEVVEEPERIELFACLEQLVLPELCLHERLEIVHQLRQVLAIQQEHPPPSRLIDSSQKPTHRY